MNVSKESEQAMLNEFIDMSLLERETTTLTLTPLTPVTP